MARLVVSPYAGLAFDGMPTPTIRISRLVSAETPFWIDDASSWPGLSNIVVENNIKHDKSIVIGCNILDELLHIGGIPPYVKHVYLNPASYFIMKECIAENYVKSLNYSIHLFPYTNPFVKPDEINSFEPSMLPITVDNADQDPILVITAKRHENVPVNKFVTIAESLDIDTDNIYVFSVGHPNIIESVKDYIDLLSRTRFVIGLVDQTFILASLLGAKCISMLPLTMQYWNILDDIERATNNALIKLWIDAECGYNCDSCQKSTCIVLSNTDIILQALKE